MPTPRMKAIRYWIMVSAIAVFAALAIVLTYDNLNARSDAVKSLDKSRASATRRIDMLTQEIADLRRNNTRLERENSVLCFKGEPTTS